LVEGAEAQEAASVASSAQSAEATRPPSTNGSEEQREGGARRRRGRRGRGGDRGARVPRAEGGDERIDVETSAQPGEHAAPTLPDRFESTAAAAPGLPSSPEPLPESTPGAPVAHEAPQRIAADGIVDALHPLETEASQSVTQHPEPALPKVSEQPIVVDEIVPTSLALPPESDLVLVETRFAPVEQEEEARDVRPRRTRPPRVTIPDEPLQMIETQKRDGP
jgi:hypothetical protein